MVFVVLFIFAHFEIGKMLMFGDNSGSQTGWAFLREFHRKVFKQQHFPIHLPYKRPMRSRRGLSENLGAF